MYDQKFVMEPIAGGAPGQMSGAANPLQGQDSAVANQYAAAAASAVPYNAPPQAMYKGPAPQAQFAPLPQYAAPQMQPQYQAPMYQPVPVQYVQQPQYQAPPVQYVQPQQPVAQAPVVAKSAEPEFDIMKAAAEILARDVVAADPFKNQGIASTLAEAERLAKGETADELDPAPFLKGIAEVLKSNASAQAKRDTERDHALAAILTHNTNLMKGLQEAVAELQSRPISDPRGVVSGQPIPQGFPQQFMPQPQSAAYAQPMQKGFSGNYGQPYAQMAPQAPVNSFIPGAPGSAPQVNPASVDRETLLKGLDDLMTEANRAGDHNRFNYLAKAQVSLESAGVIQPALRDEVVGRLTGSTAQWNRQGGNGWNQGQF